jgi:hypothetical protein
MVRAGLLYKRYDAKKGKAPPPGFEPCGEPDERTGHNPGWLLVGDGPEDKWHREAGSKTRVLSDGTYELCGEKFQGNPEKISGHVFIRHGSEVLENVPRDYDGLKSYFSEHVIEGVVWHHSDGRMAKIKRSDFGFEWPKKGAQS